MLEPDGFLGGRLRLLQPPRGAHRAGTDAVLLAGLLAPEPSMLVYDIGAGTGAVGLACARMHGCRVALVERDPELAELARGNIARNAIAGACVIVADMFDPGAKRRAAGLLAETADIVLTNPPYFGAARHRPSPNPQKASAHDLAGGDLDAWIRACTDVLRPDGRLGLVHRADALPECLDALRGRFGGVAIRPVHPRADRPAIRILLHAVKGSRASLSLLPALILQEDTGRFMPEADALHRGEAWSSPGDAG